MTTKLEYLLTKHEVAYAILDWLRKNRETPTIKGNVEMNLKFDFTGNLLNLGDDLSNQFNNLRVFIECDS